MYASGCCHPMLHALVAANHRRHGLGLPWICNTPPQSDVHITLRHRLHAEHLTKKLVLVDSQCLCENIRCHLIRPNELQFDSPVLNAFTNKMIPDVHMLSCSMVDWLGARRSAAWLSMWSLVRPRTSSRSSERRRRNHTSSLAASAAAMYSACVEEVATVLCCFDDHDTAPPAYRKACPETE